MALDLTDAVLRQLRATPAVVAAFGDTYNADTETGTSKFFAEYAGQVAYPYLVIREPGETYSQMTQAFSPQAVYELVDGTMQIYVFATDRSVARSLGALVAGALNDKAMSWTGTGTNLMLFRRTGAGFVPVPTTGVNVPSVYCRQVTFTYEFQEQMPT